MKLKIIKGYYLTPTEKDYIKLMLQHGWTKATNSIKTKSYLITNLTPERFDIKIGTYAVWTIGDIHRWQYQYLAIEYTK